MKRRDFLKIGVGTVLTVPMAVHGSASQTIAEPIQYHDWSVKFRALNASITKETYAAFFNEEQREQNPVGFLNYLLSGTDLPHCETVENMEWHDGYGGGAVTFTGVVFASNTRRHAANRFAGFDRTGFCLSSPDSQSGMYLWFSEKVA